MALRSPIAFCFPLCAAVLAGCGGGSGSETVSGKVTLDGAPLPNARVMLIPVDTAIKGPFLAVTDGQGAYSIGPIGEPGGGAPAGAYRLTIGTAFTSGGDENAVPPPERVPTPYPQGVDFEVPAGGKSDANFDLTSR